MCNPYSRIAIYGATYGRTEYESLQCAQPAVTKDDEKNFTRKLKLKWLLQERWQIDFLLSLPCELHDRDGDEDLSWTEEVLAYSWQCDVWKAMSARDADVFESRLHLRWVVWAWMALEESTTTFPFVSPFSTKEMFERSLRHSTRVRRASPKRRWSRSRRVVRRRSVLQRTRSNPTGTKASRRFSEREGIRHTVHKCPVVFGATSAAKPRRLIAGRWVKGWEKEWKFS
jgi:hypothetical protein